MVTLGVTTATAYLFRTSLADSRIWYVALTNGCVCGLATEAMQYTVRHVLFTSHTMRWASTEFWPQQERLWKTSYENLWNKLESTEPAIRFIGGDYHPIL